MPAIVRRAIVAFALLCSLPTVPVASAVCAGDCNGDGTVVVGEIITAVNIALGAVDISACRAIDLNNDNMVSVSEIISAVGSLLNGCPIEPIFPANYRDTFTVVRDCRLGIEHGGVTIRVLANSTGFQPYLGLQDPLPVGTIVVKEEYSGTDCNDPTKLVSWSAMRKEAPGFDPVDGDWHWQRIPAPGSTVQTCLRKDDCPGFTCTISGCHAAPTCVTRDYMCTADVRGKLYPVMQDLPGALLSISGTAPNDIYAVGADAHDGKGPSVLHSADGSTWSRLDSGVASGSLWWISVTPIDGDFYMAGDNGVILQFDPKSGKFTRAATPDDTVQLYGIWGTAANDLWAVGGDVASHAVVWHFDGMMWSTQDVSNVVPSDDPTALFKVWGTSATDVYAVGQTGVIIHYDGQKWSRITMGVPTTNLFTVHGNGSVLVAVGGFVQSGVILEQSGPSFVDHAPSGAPAMNGVFVAPNGNVVTVGVGLSVATGDSSGWRLIDEGTDRKNRDYHGTWVDSEDGIWAVGGDLSNMNNGILSYGRSQ